MAVKRANKEKNKLIGNTSLSNTSSLASNRLPKDRIVRVVGIGASAGGLEAFEQFFSQIPPDTGLAFIIVQHLDPTGHSSLPQILSRFTTMPIMVASDGLHIEPNSVYLLPPNKFMTIKSGALHLEEPSQPPGLRLSIDFFFRSLASEMGPDAICVILSGTGTDGTLGLRVIKAALGTVFVQDPESAKYDGMPRSAIETGLADFILKPGDIPGKLVLFIGHLLVNDQKLSIASKEAEEPMKQIFSILRMRTGHDFMHYKQTTIRRRLQRRMSVNQIDDIAQYALLLKDSEVEVKALLKDFLISVTSFFRDTEAFEALKFRLKELIQGKPSYGDLRVWVAGCATGEEVYSIAILVHESLDEHNNHSQVQVYGTDIDIDALRIARTGKYPVNIAADITPDRLKRYFIKENDNYYRVNKEIRETIIFAPQNFIKDPPFSRMDLICCRNLLIYLESDLQKRLFPIMHYALKPGGLLFLGSSETVGEPSDLFTIIDKKWKIYQKRNSVNPTEHFRFPAASAVSGQVKTSTVQQTINPTIQELSERIFLDIYAPTFAVIDDKYHLVYVRGRTGSFLEIVSGQPSLSILDLARDELRTGLASAIRVAKLEKRMVIQEGLKVKTNGHLQIVNLTVAPITGPNLPLGHLMVIFQEAGVIPCDSDMKQSAKGLKWVKDIENELKLTQESLHTTVEDLEASNEELKSANEELQSNNEELQSSNEELDTSREELQSLNEELTTLNAELQDKNEQLFKANDDLKNFLNRTDIAIVFLDEDLRIRSFTPATFDIFNIRDIDTGRPLSEITSRLDYDNVILDAHEVLRTLRPIESEVQRKDGTWYKMRILPYLTAQNVVSGLVISFLDFDDEKKAINDLKNINQQLEDLARFPQENPFPVLRVQKDGTILYANAACSTLDPAICQPGQILPDVYRINVIKALEKGIPQFIETKGPKRVFGLNFMPIKAAGYVNVYGIDITEIINLQLSLRESEERFRVISETSPIGIGVSSLDGMILYVNPSYEAILGYHHDELVSRKAPDLYVNPEDRAKWLEIMKNSGVVRYFETRLKKKDGSQIWVSIGTSPIIFAGNQAVLGTIQDISEAKQAEESLKKYAADMERSSKELESFNFSISHDLRAPLRALDGFSELIIQDYEDKIDETGKDFLRRIRSASQTMSGIIDDMGRLYRASRIAMNLSKIDISLITGSILDDLKAGQPDRQAEFVIEPGLIVTADLSLITILLRNLLENAWKFTKKCQNSKIEVGARDQNGTKTYFVKDNGAGFDMKYADKLFKAFQRLHDERDFEGSGIGLAIAEKVITRHNGKIWAEAGVDKGTTIYFTLWTNEKDIKVLKCRKNTFCSLKTTWMRYF